MSYSLTAFHSNYCTAVSVCWVPICSVIQDYDVLLISIAHDDLFVTDSSNKSSSMDTGLFSPSTSQLIFLFEKKKSSRPKKKIGKLAYSIQTVLKSISSRIDPPVEQKRTRRLMVPTKADIFWVGSWCILYFPIFFLCQR